jgi:hypothetical protein
VGKKADFHLMKYIMERRRQLMKWVKQKEWSMEVVIEAKIWNSR